MHTKAPVADAKLKAAMGLGSSTDTKKPLKKGVGSSTDTKKPLKKGALKKKPAAKPLGEGTGAKPLGKGSGHALKAPAGRWLKIYRTNANKALKKKNTLAKGFNFSRRQGKVNTLATGGNERKCPSNRE